MKFFFCQSTAEWEKKRVTKGVVDRLRKIVKVIYLSEKKIHQPLGYYEETYTFARKLQVSWFEMNLDGQARKVRSYEGGRRPPEKILK